MNKIPTDLFRKYGLTVAEAIEGLKKIPPPTEQELILFRQWKERYEAKLRWRLYLKMAIAGLLVGTVIGLACS